jgi:predicted DCC family thiol-disulfide oxidoreductase YuxK
MNAHSQTLVFYDGACAMCTAEIELLRRWDRSAKLDLIDIAAPAFDARAWPVSLAAMNAALHVRLPDDTWLTGMAATRHIYRAVGRGWMVAFTGWPLISRVFDRAYAWFAKHRMPISARLGTRRCTDGACRLS